jgi:hypothetical protein
MLAYIDMFTGFHRCISLIFSSIEVNRLDMLGSWLVLFNSCA